MTANAWGRARTAAFEHERMVRAVNAQHQHRRDVVMREHAVPFQQRASIVAAFNRGVGELGYTDASRAYFDSVRRFTAMRSASASFRSLVVAGRAEALRRRDTLTEWSSDDAVCMWARRRAAECQARALSSVDPLAECEAYCSEWGIDPVAVRRDACGQPLDDVGPALARMYSRRWWTLRARRKLDRDIEVSAVRAGRVGKGASVYVSARNLKRGEDQAARNRQTLLELEAVNELGQAYSIADLAEKSISNPHIRHAELMVRLKGCEMLADRMGWVGRFITWTLPSRFHAVRARNQNWIDGGMATAREGQLFLRDLWARARALLAKLGLRYFGVRVAEPHNDGTPHWHMLLFVQLSAADTVCDVLRRYAMSESPDETGAAEHRFKVEVIDKARGGATAYVAKYVSKHTTAKGLGAHTDTGPDGVTAEVCGGWDGAQRVRRWASVNGIRQFQFVGTPPIGLYREMRRIEGEIPRESNGRPLTAKAWASLENARRCADVGDYAGHVAAVGGAAVPRAQQRLEVWREVDGTCTAYGDLRPAQTRGVAYRVALVRAVDVVRVDARGRNRRRVQRERYQFAVGEQCTRLHVWTLRPRSGVASLIQGAEGESSAPWTRVNNCNRGSDDGRENAGAAGARGAIGVGAEGDLPPLGAGLQQWRGSAGDVEGSPPAERD